MVCCGFVAERREESFPLELGGKTIWVAREIFDVIDAPVRRHSRGVFTDELPVQHAPLNGCFQIRAKTAAEREEGCICAAIRSGGTACRGLRGGE